MVAGDAVFVQPDPWPDQEHGGAGGADEIRQHRAAEQEEDIVERGGLAPGPNMDAAGHDEERGNEGDEADIFPGHPEHPHAGMEAYSVEPHRNQPKADGYLFEMMLPECRQQERHRGDAQQQCRKRQAHPGLGIGHGNGIRGFAESARLRMGHTTSVRSGTRQRFRSVQLPRRRTPPAQAV